MGLVDGLGVRLPLFVLGDRPVDAGQARGAPLAFAGRDDQVWADRRDGLAAGAAPEHRAAHRSGRGGLRSGSAPGEQAHRGHDRAGHGQRRAAPEQRPVPHVVPAVAVHEPSRWSGARPGPRLPMRRRSSRVPAGSAVQPRPARRPPRPACPLLLRRRRRPAPVGVASQRWGCHPVCTPRGAR